MRGFVHDSAGFFVLCFGYVAALAPCRLGQLEEQPATSHVQKRDVILLEQRQEKKSPAPIVADVSQFWEGNDGPWSSFVLQVGNASQEVRVLPSTASSSTWVVYADPGCNNVPVTDCLTSRGKTFQRSLSRTWTPASIGQTAFFELGLEENLLGREVYGEFGWDVISLGWPDSGGPTVEHSVVAGIGDTHFTWLGVLGLNPRPTNFTNMRNDPQASFVQKLKDQGDIPSLSWAYTAGAQYRLNSVYGSLVLGGYDESRFIIPSGTDPSLAFPFYTDIARDLLVGIPSITSSSTLSSGSETKLLSDGIFAFVDSTIPHLWLPESVCRAFEEAFNLTWESDTELYILTAAQHNALLELNASITFNLSPTLSPKANDKSVAITMPYASFDLNVSWPFGGGRYNNESTYYFPLKRAANVTQYTLGRAFLQEAYLIADYERQNFSIWPCQWDSSVTSAQVVPILSLDTVKTEVDKKNLSTGAIAGIVVGGAAGLVALGLAIFLCIRRRRRASDSPLELERAQTDNFGGSLPSYYPHRARSATELSGTGKHELHEHDRCEAPGGDKFEMSGDGTPHEADGTEKRVIYEMDAGGDGIGGMHGVRITVEPPTALSPRPESVLPSPTNSSPTTMMSEEDQKGDGDESPTKDLVNDEKDGVRSFFGFIKAFRRSGKL